MSRSTIFIMFILSMDAFAADSSKELRWASVDLVSPTIPNLLAEQYGRTLSLANGRVRPKAVIESSAQLENLDNQVG